MTAPKPGDPQSTDVTSSALPWRKVTPLHHTVGARVLRGTLTIGNTIGAVGTLLQTYYGPGSIDRVIGVRLSLQNAYRANGVAFYVTDLSSGWRMDFSSAVMGGVWQFNCETLVDAANLAVVNEAALALVFNYSLYNVEVVPHVMAG